MASAKSRLERVEDELSQQDGEIIIVYGDDEEGGAPSAEELEEAREVVGRNGIVIQVVYGLDPEAVALTEEIDTMLGQ